MVRVMVRVSDPSIPLETSAVAILGAERVAQSLLTELVTRFPPPLRVGDFES